MTLKTTLQPLIELALLEDFAQFGDVTSQAIIPVQSSICASITAKASGVIAGLEAVLLVYQHIDPTVTVRKYVDDGAQVSAGTVVCEVEGAALSVLSGERTALNFLQRLSGIATLTRRFVDAVAGT